MVHREAPAMFMIYNLKEQGIAEREAVREAFSTFPSFAKHISRIDLNNINDALPAEAVPLISFYLKKILEEPLLERGFMRQVQMFPTMNAWVRFQVLKTIEKP